MFRSVILSLSFFALNCHCLQAEIPTETGERLSVIGSPVSLEVLPETISLSGPRANQQVLVTGVYADGSVRDLTSLSEWKSSAPELLEITSEGLATGRRDGATYLDIQVAGLAARVPVTIADSNQPRPVSFRREFMPLLSVAGCSDIRCHGAPSGKSEFRLSLWGFDPDLDFRQLTHDGLGRRTNSLAPDKSLILAKALMRIPHAGGRRFDSDSPYARLMRDWQSEGLQDDAGEVAVRTLTASPSRRVLQAPAKWQQLAVRAEFDDGHSADVTRLTTFFSSDIAIADVDRTGRVEFKGQGEVAILCRFLGRMQAVRLMYIAQPAADYQWPEPPANNYVDTHVFAKLKLLNIAPSTLCSDEQFVRRVYLDVCGILPTPDETQKFVAATEPDKRAQLIDQLLQRPEYADFWTKKWMDVLRASRDSIQLAGAQAYQKWLRDRIEADASFAEIAQALLTSKGKSYSDAPANFYCVPPTPKTITDAAYLQKDLTEATAQLFLGVRLQCVRCHDHPYEKWKHDDYLSIAAHFTQVKRSRLGKAGPAGRPERRQIEIALDFNSPEVTNESGEVVAPRLPGEQPSEVPAEQDRRELLADWLTRKDNPFFAKAVVNRIWFHLHGRGVVEPVDDFRDSNPSANDELLEALAAEFAEQGFRLKPLIRTIVNSRTYQLSPVPTASNQSDHRYFSHMFSRPLSAEVLLDAVCNVTGIQEVFEIANDYTIGIPDGSTTLPVGTRAVQLPVTDTETLINTMGKYVRYEPHPFLRTFGQPSRTQTCECDRAQHFGRKQALELIIGQMTSNRLTDKDNRLGHLLAEKRSDTEMLNELYLCALSRRPSEATAKSLSQHVATSTDKRQAWEDILWTILNSQEFIYQH
ncbi:MAG: DUF1549 and DUF1553 domain-containing protein [Planctomycetales bacterium]